MVVVSVDCHLGEGMSMEEPASARLFDSFAYVSEPRSANVRYRLFDIFVIALCAVISGAEGWEDMEEYGQAQVEWFQQFLEAIRKVWIALTYGSHEYYQVFPELLPMITPPRKPYLTDLTDDQ